MKSLTRVFLVALLGCSSVLTLQAQEALNYFLHTIEKGQSLYSLSNMYGVSQEDIVKMNPGADEKLYAGQKLKIPQMAIEVKEERYHTIQPGETVYRLTKIYEISDKELIDENPGLSAENFKMGEVIRIPSPKKNAVENTETIIIETPAAVVPRCKEMHKVKRKETIFSVSNKYGISEQELVDANPELSQGMKRGQLLCIPYTTTKPVVSKNQNQRPMFETAPPSNTELFKANREKHQPIPTIKAAIILPFLLEGEGKGESSKMVEYYEGFLMAVDSLKKRGVNMDIHTYDSGNKQTPINAVLANEELKTMDVIFGPLYQEHVEALSAFADEHNIRLVIPITSRANEVYQNPQIFQVNPPQSYLYSEVYDHFIRHFANVNVVFLDMKTNDKDKQEFISGLKQELQKQKISMQTLDGNLPVETLKEALQPGKTNVFIPTSGDNVTLLKLLPRLKLLVREATEFKIQLFGYPEWQTLTKEHLETFFELDTYFYSWFYTNNLFPAAINLVNSYHKNYSKEMSATYPRYAMLGYDTALFFLSGLAKYGTGFEDNIQWMRTQTVQTGLKFSRVNNWGGFINRKVYFVRFNRFYEITKIDFD